MSDRRNDEEGDTQIFNRGTMSSIQKLGLIMALCGGVVAMSASLVKSYFLTPYQIESLQKLCDDNTRRLTAVELSTGKVSGQFDLLNSKLDSMRQSLEQVQNDIRSIERRSTDKARP